MHAARPWRRQLEVGARSWSSKSTTSKPYTNVSQIRSHHVPRVLCDAVRGTLSPLISTQRWLFETQEALKGCDFIKLIGPRALLYSTRKEWEAILRRGFEA